MMPTRVLLYVRFLFCFLLREARVVGAGPATPMCVSDDCPGHSRVVVITSRKHYAHVGSLCFPGQPSLLSFETPASPEGFLSGGRQSEDPPTQAGGDLQMSWPLRSGIGRDIYLHCMHDTCGGSCLCDSWLCEAPLLLYLLRNNSRSVHRGAT